jgi:hypothetical protein
MARWLELRNNPGKAMGQGKAWGLDADTDDDRGTNKGTRASNRAMISGYEWEA